MRKPTRCPRLNRFIRTQWVGSVGGLSKLARSPQITSLPDGCPAWGGGGAGGVASPRPRPPPWRWPSAPGCCCPTTLVASVTPTSNVAARSATPFRRILIDSPVLHGLRSRRPHSGHHLVPGIRASENRCDKSSHIRCRSPFHRASPLTAEKNRAPDNPQGPCLL